MSQIQKQNNQIDELKFGHSMRRFSAENSTMVNSVSSLVPNAIETSDMKTHDGSHIM